MPKLEAFGVRGIFDLIFDLCIDPPTYLVMKSERMLMLLSWLAIAKLVTIGVAHLVFKFRFDLGPI